MLLTLLKMKIMIRTRFAHSYYTNNVCLRIDYNCCLKICENFATAREVTNRHDLMFELCCGAL